MNLSPQEENKEIESLALPDAEILYVPNFFSSEVASEYFEVLLKETYWQEDTIKIFGKEYLQPRLTALQGSSEKTYTYSGITMHPKPLSKTILKIKNKVEDYSQEKFNTVMLNLYRNGNDSNGWHSDNEKELGKNPIIASVSFGEERWFHLRHKMNKPLKHKMLLENGSLLIMKGTTQHFWHHQIPKTKKIVSERINLTFRKLF